MELFQVYTLGAILIISALYLHSFFAGSRGNLPPGPRQLPLFGNLLDLGSGVPHRSLARLAARHGPLMTLRLGSVTTVVASSADTARDVLQRHDATLSTRSVPDVTRVFAHDQLSMGWLPPGSPLFRALRRVCNLELFAPQRLDAHQSLRREKVQRLVLHVAGLARQDTAVDIRRVTITTALNLLSCTIFSTDISDLDDRGASGEFMKLIEEFPRTVGTPNLSDFFPEMAALDPQRLRARFMGVSKKMQAILNEQIERSMQQRAAGDPPKNDFLDLLLDYRGMEKGRGFDRQTLLILLMDLFTAGTDRNAATVEWAMAELLQSPSSMAKARDELAQVIGSKQEIDESDIGKLKYLQAIMKETFRLHPPAPLLLPRQAETTTEIRGYTVPKGTRVLVNVWAIGQDPELWVEPKKFMPERFMEKEIDFRGRDFELVPFGSGRRICPGLPLAVRMVPLMLSTLLHRFEWTLPMDVQKNGLDMSDKFGVVLGMSKPLQAIAKPI